MKKKNIEYPDAPSGFVSLYNYKEPFMKFEKGYGYEGVLLFDGETEQVQCHFCGDWFGFLAPHLKREHNMATTDYKRLTGLRKSTALLSESAREKLVIAKLDNPSHNLRPGGKMSEETKQKIRETNVANGKIREQQNEHGTCPLQLIERLKQLYIEKGRTPTNNEITFGESLERVFGSVNKALHIADIPIREPGQTIHKRKSTYTRDEIVEYVRLFASSHSKLPRFKNFSDKTMYNALKKYGKKEIFEEALTNHKKYIKIKSFRYTNEQLLDFLRDFQAIHGRKPSYSDAKRGLLPNLSRYSNRFGSWKKAVELALV